MLSVVISPASFANREKEMLEAADVAIAQVLRYFTQKNLEVAFLVPTDTGMKKGIMDATTPVRDFLKQAGIHDFDRQPQGEAHKKVVRARVVTCSGIFETQISLYRPVTKKGDPRVWVYGLKAFAEPKNVLALVAIGASELLVINASSAGLVPGVVGKPDGPLFVRDAHCIDLDELLAPLVLRQDDVAVELLARIRAFSANWHRGIEGARRDLEVGRLLEQLLEINPNSSKAPDYKGIELKASRKGAGTRQTLFAKVPDWPSSPMKSSAAILDAFGYARSDRYVRQLRCTVSAKAINAQGLFLRLEAEPSRLLEASNKQEAPKVAYWPMEGLKHALLSKHPETFWVTAASKRDDGTEWFKYEHVLHTRKPLATALPTLLESGTITVDHLISRDLRGRVTEKGPLFKIHRRDFDLLFPPGQLYAL